jgi:hypothetical protein
MGLYRLDNHLAGGESPRCSLTASLIAAGLNKIRMPNF